MVSQNLLNLVDTAMVGALGDSALAATGVGGFAFFMAIATMMGLSAAVQAMAARRIGEGRADEAAAPLNGALLLALGFGVPLTAALVWATPWFFPLLNSDPAVYEQGVPYLQYRLATLALGGMAFGFRGFFNGIGRPIVYMRTLMITHVVNIVLNYLLIFGVLGAPKLGVVGAGIGSAIATCRCLIYGFQAWLEARDGLAQPSWRAALRSLVALSVPASAQHFLRSRAHGHVLDHRFSRHPSDGGGERFGQHHVGRHFARGRDGACGGDPRRSGARARGPR